MFCYINKYSVTNTSTLSRNLFPPLIFFEAIGVTYSFAIFLTIHVQVHKKLQNIFNVITERVQNKKAQHQKYIDETDKPKCILKFIFPNSKYLVCVKNHLRIFSPSELYIAKVGNKFDEKL